MIKKIVNHYTMNDTLDMCMEEAGELVHAINKYKRASNFGYATETNQSNARKKLVQAIADAKNAINSVIYVLDIDGKEVEKEINRADRQLMELLERLREIRKTDEKQAKNEFHSEDDVYPEKYWVEENAHDTVNHPSHYCTGGIECIDVIKATSQGMNGIDAFCQGNAMKYLFRWQYKNGVEDLKKARWYIDKLIERWDGEINNEKK